MTRELVYVTFSTSMGWVGILSSARGLVRTTLPQPSATEARRLLGVDRALWSPGLFEELINRFRTYFSGRKITFPDRLDLCGATAFQRQVWEVTRLIPYGSTESYAWVAKRMEKPGAARAVGQALSKNPLPIVVPCHRVLTSGGKLGGFSGGLEMKRSLLHLEAMAITR
jgi:methylated-DNA-[protein]-cysteine S-methyltransferase